MTVVEKIAYTKGFFSGLDIDSKSKEGKAFNALLELLEELVVSNADLEKECENLKSRVSGIDEHVAEVFSNVFDNASYGPGHEDHHSAVLFEVVCPECDTKTSFGQSIALQGRMACPGCGINLEFDYDKAPKDEEMDMADEMPAEPVMQIAEAEEVPFSAEAPERIEAQEEVAAISLQKTEQPGVTFSTAPPIPESEGEKDQIPQTEDFIYSESTEDEEEAVAEMSAEAEEGSAEAEVQTVSTEEIPAEEPDAQILPADETQSEMSPEESAEEKEDAEIRSALVKVDFVADPEAFEAGRKKAEEYKYSTENVTTDFNALVPDSPELSGTMDA